MAITDKLDKSMGGMADIKIPYYVLREAGFRRDGDYMYRTTGETTHRFVKVAEGNYVYDGQSDYVPK